MNYVQTILHAAKVAKTSGLILLAICTHETKLNNIIVKNDGGTPSYGICMVKYNTAKMLGYQGTPKGLMNPKDKRKMGSKLSAISTVTVWRLVQSYCCFQRW